MNELKFYPGGHPLSIDDLTWLQTAMRFGFEALMTSMGTGFILSGCAVTRAGGMLNVGPGVVVHDSEILLFDGASISLLYEPGAYFEAHETNDVQTVTYKDLIVRDVYKIRKAKLNGNVAVGGNFAYFDRNRVQNTVWTEVVPEPDFDFATVAAGPTRLSYKTVNRELIVRGRITVDTAWANGSTLAVFPIPDIWRPLVTVAMPVVLATSGITIIASPGSGFISMENNTGGVIADGTEIVIGEFRYRLD